MALRKKCIKYSGEDKECSVKQKGKTFRLINEYGLTITSYIVDSCLIPNQEYQKCDYLFLAEKHCFRPKRAYLVELKGSDLSAAIRQLTNSVDILYPEIKDYAVFGRIVGKRVTPHIKKRQVRLGKVLKRLKGNLKIISAREYREYIDN